MKFGPIGTE